MNFFKFFVSTLFIFFFFSVTSNAEKIVYIDMDKIMKLSKAGKTVIEKINSQKKKDVNKFRKIEEDLKAQEIDLINNDYRRLRQEAIDSSTNNRLNASADFANKIKPILAEYAGENNIDMVIQKKILLWENQI